MLDQVARMLAAGSHDDHRAKRQLSRGAFVRRGFGVLAVGAVGGLVPVGTAQAARGCPAGSRQSCYNARASQFRRGVRECDGLAASLADKYLCFRSAYKLWHAGRRDCRESCPPPEKKPPSRPASQKPKRPPPHPPPLPPNPYDSLALACATCTSVGGKCCYGGKDPKQLCACGNPTLPCSRYGCSS